MPTPPRRLSTVSGIGASLDLTPHGSVVVLADARAPATALIDVLSARGGVVAVRRGGALRGVAISFETTAPPLDMGATWIEVRLGAAIEVERVPSASTLVADIPAAVAAIRPRHAESVDVLVAADTSVGNLVAMAAALLAAGTAELGLGRAPARGSDDALARGDQGGRILAGPLEVDGPLDADAVRPVLGDARRAMRACYQRALARAPNLAGTSSLWLDVDAHGDVAFASAPGIGHPIDRELTGCVMDAVVHLRFAPRADESRIEQTLMFVR